MSKILRVSQVLKLARAASFIESFYGDDNDSEDDYCDKDSNNDDDDDGIDTIGTFPGILDIVKAVRLWPRQYGCQFFGQGSILQSKQNL